MDFDFRALYASYTTKELLQIIATPQQYQASAVKAAEDILATRNADEIEAVKAGLHDVSSLPLTAQPAGRNLHQGIFDEDEPEQTTSIRRYRLIITIAISILVGFSLFQQGIRLWYMGDASFLISDIHTAISTGIELVSIVAIIFFIQKRNTGWVLMAGVVTFYLLSFLMALLLFVYYRNFSRLFYSALLLLLYSGVAYLLWMPGIKNACKVNEQTARRTVTISAIATIAYCIWIMTSMWPGN